MAVTVGTETLDRAITRLAEFITHKCGGSASIGATSLLGGIAGLSLVEWHALLCELRERRIMAAQHTARNLGAASVMS